MDWKEETGRIGENGRNYRRENSGGTTFAIETQHITVNPTPYLCLMDCSTTVPVYICSKVTNALFVAKKVACNVTKQQLGRPRPVILKRSKHLYLE
jgi:hypothetical protein